ncbi:hypothetical protein WL80_23940 [Burkholderia ubonensis]|uniref:hypothetical protein n=1 Tax=Burkholderia ubonensis TaxID=101571 RepID=UPI00075804C9|nr:hypothetical protein [Burkholderia ubonensis]KVO03697.1 hypothetical protein WJ69_26875 [Burkholderia ubonensis]KVO20936.1 hypothetical protein WJ73_01210 [Burkholderia ubonensis]KWE84202.1 hypothetical protein WL80_23940 [Burkholderia ubonensis]
MITRRDPLDAHDRRHQRNLLIGGAGGIAAGFLFTPFFFFLVGYTQLGRIEWVARCCIYAPVVLVVGGIVSVGMGLYLGFRPTRVRIDPHKIDVKREDDKHARRDSYR